MIVSKAVKMAAMMNVPIIGIVENMSYLECPDCGKKISVFGESHVEDIAQRNGLKVLGKLPIDPQIATAVDRGAVETLNGDWLNDTLEAIEKLPHKE